MTKRDEYRKYAVTIHLTKEERDKIEKAAKKKGLSNSGYIRSKVLYNSKEE